MLHSLINIGRVLPSKINQVSVGAVAVVLGVAVMLQLGVVNVLSVIMSVVVFGVPLPVSSDWPEVAES